MDDLDLPYLVYTKNNDGSRTYFYRNTTREKESKFMYECYLEEQKKYENCKCPLHRKE